MQPHKQSYKPDAGRDTKVRHVFESGTDIGTSDMGFLVAHSIVVYTAAVVRAPLAAAYWVADSTAFLATRDKRVRRVVLGGWVACEEGGVRRVGGV